MQDPNMPDGTRMSDLPDLDDERPESHDDERHYFGCVCADCSGAELATDND